MSRIIKLGIECENLEDPKSRWGVGQITLNLLKEYAANPEYQKRFKFYLYFKKRIPDDEVLKNQIFIKRVLKFPSFNIFYHILLPVRALVDGLDWMFFPAYMLPPLYLGKSIVMLTDDVYYEYKYGNLPFRYKLAYRLFTNWAAIRANKILAISETSKKEITKLYGIRPEKIFVSYLGVRNPKYETLNFKQIQNSNVPNSKQFGISDLGFRDYILFVGQMFPRRHTKETILAFEKLIQEHSNILQNVGMLDLKLILVGPDKYPTPIIDSMADEINKKLGREAVIHKNNVKDDELAQLYKNAKALVYVSDKEAFGFPPMEALSFGVPPIIADNELGHELFENYAIYTKGSSPDEIANTIRQVLSDSDKIKLINNTGPEFVKKYNWQSFTDKFLDVIQK